MENNIDLQMADRLQELRDEKEQLEIALKETNGMIEAVEQDLITWEVYAYLTQNSALPWMFPDPYRPRA